MEKAVRAKTTDRRYDFKCHWTNMVNKDKLAGREGLAAALSTHLDHFENNLDITAHLKTHISLHLCTQGTHVFAGINRKQIVNSSWALVTDNTMK